MQVQHAHCMDFHHRR